MSPPRVLQQQDIIFSPASQVLRQALSELKRSNLTIHNRLQSIYQDSKFVASVSEAYNDAPLIANERCGSWYIPPDRKRGSVYFKSTDGHFGQWAFSLRRLNFTLFDYLQSSADNAKRSHSYNADENRSSEATEARGGCVIIIDSTRRGKSMSDAMSKTVPIWACVWNRVLFPDCQYGEDLELHTPSDVVSESEHAQIDSRVQGWVEDVKRLALDLEGLRNKLNGRPIRLSWQRPGDEMPTQEDLRGARGANLIVLCTASNQTSNETSATSDYVQGAADDPESWSLGLNATMFWRCREELIAASEDELPELIGEIVADARKEIEIAAPRPIRPTCNLFVGTNTAAEPARPGDFDFVISCTTKPDEALVKTMKDRYIVLSLPEGKNGSRMLRTELLKLEMILPALDSKTKVLATCHTGKDLSIGMALALLCKCFNDSGLVKQSSDKVSVNKNLIKQRLSWIMISIPDASPSRATLQSVNSWLMG
ncbi:hypothetical protein CBER1_04289 [Cercospora berteroae]|uniref:Initiator tRNA phosphoribosyl transferase n=1 Tax=Cercospora berteroae TaxID=357750 RepID=A0A2S6C6D5_9PEZI|nr:hypothetical protein CBER1_04289 [Cercospora berteroae]